MVFVIRKGPAVVRQRMQDAVNMSRPSLSCVALALYLVQADGRHYKVWYSYAFTFGSSLLRVGYFTLYMNTLIQKWGCTIHHRFRANYERYVAHEYFIDERNIASNSQYHKILALEK